MAKTPQHSGAQNTPQKVSILPAHFSPLEKALDLAIRAVIKKHFHLPMRYFYNPEDNPHLPLIAHTFDINLDTKMPLYQQRAQLEKPLLKKIHLGTEKGIQEACAKVFGPIQLITYANQPKDAKLPLKPFEYQVKIQPSSQNALDVRRAIREIKTIQPARDRFKRLLIDFPKTDITLREVAAARLRAGFNHRFKFTRTITPPLSHQSAGRLEVLFNQKVRYTKTYSAPLSVAISYRFALTLKATQRSQDAR